MPLGPSSISAIAELVLKLQNQKVGKVKKFEHMVAIEKNVQSRTKEVVGL